MDGGGGQSKQRVIYMFKRGTTLCGTGEENHRGKGSTSDKLIFGFKESPRKKKDSKRVRHLELNLQIYIYFSRNCLMCPW